MLRFAAHGTGAGAAGVVGVAHGLVVTPDWCHAQARTSTVTWRATLGNPPATNVNANVMIHNAQLVHYSVYAHVWQGRSY